MGSGATFKELSGTKLGTLEIPLPLITIQLKLVKKLDAIFCEIEKSSKAVEANSKNADSLFQNYLMDIFQKGGSTWEVKELNQISENLDSKRIPITKGVREEGEIPYYGASGIVDYVKDFIFDDELLLVSEDGANLLARTYPIAFSVSGKCWVNNHAHVVKFQSLISQKFVEFYLNSISLEPYVSGMAQPKLNQAMLNKIPIPFPVIEEQKKLVNMFESMKDSTNSLRNSCVTKMIELQKLKEAVLQKAFNGELITE
jgi:type I restriction enzyme S subunit